MSIHDSRRAVVTKRLTAFGGIRSIARISDSCASEMTNFRILPDGSLEKRCGYGTVIQSSGAIRGYWEGNLAGTHYIFYVAGTSLYRRSQSDTAPVLLTTLNASDARVSFLLFCGVLYLFDGFTVLAFKPALGIFSAAMGYVPLYGKDWHPDSLGDVNEPLNLLCNSIRVHYLNSTATQVFHLPFTAARIQSVTVGGAPITNYTFKAPSSTVTIPASAATGGDVVIAFDLDAAFSNRSAVVKACHGAVYRDGCRETLLTFGGESGYRVFRTAEVTEEMLAAAEKAYPGTDALYFRAEDTLSLGSAEHPVTAAVQYLDRMLIFHDSGVWVLRCPGTGQDRMEITVYQSGIGCVAPDGAVLCRGVPVVLSPSGVGRIGLISSGSDICKMTLISGNVADRLTEAVLRNAVIRWSDRENRIWLRDITDAEGTVWLSDPEGEYWTRYTGIPANLLVDCQGAPGFTTAAGKIAAFDDALLTDDGQSFEASYTGAFLDFSRPEDIRRTGYMALSADSRGAQIKLTAENDRTGHTFTFTGKVQTSPEFFGGRFGIGRFRFLRYRITVPGTARARILGLSVSVSI